MVWSLCSSAGYTLHEALLASITLQSVPQQSVQLRVELGLLLQHVEEQLVLRGAGDLRLLQPALHHLHLGLTLGGLQALWTGGGSGVVETEPTEVKTLSRLYQDIIRNVAL